ncbi:hypothetical protein NE237_018591 [Protea cynaroides]|uniref:TF-B3 domain-containing protein n=1 Tax=Protea cynaroides TaxID=273540 RepID=A0A9Q0KA90_9MAGN|nr:hypothetical protein NE237_018591 [Protea cynaroides]
MGRKPIHQNIKPSFFKVLLGGFEKQLSIPPEFIKHVNDKLPGNLYLRSPNGTWWWVKMKKIKDGWFFRKGWNHFVTYHSLKVGEFLVFYYKGNSKFSVTIYDRSACEKEPPLAKKKRNGHEEVESNSTHVTKKAVEPGESSVSKKKRIRAHKIEMNGEFEAVCLLKTERPHFTQIMRTHNIFQITVPRAFGVK